MFSLFISFSLKSTKPDIFSFPDPTAKGVVDEVISPGYEWRIRLHGVFWHAKSRSYLRMVPGQEVKIIDREGLKLFIEPL